MRNENIFKNFHFSFLEHARSVIPTGFVVNLSHPPAVAATRPVFSF
jgi:hypothetical protein